jgi:nitrate reductase alpha subunit
VLVDLWREAKQQALGDPVHAWKIIQDDPKRRRAYQQARGKGGFRRISWDEALEIAAASVVHTVKTKGPDRVAGFSPIPAMSQISYAAGSRFLSLLGGVVMSFYDWYCDLPPASPEIWGEQTDVHETADWYNSRFIAVVGSNLNMTRTPDTHFISEVRHAGAKLAVFSPDFSMVAKYADWWIPSNAGQDGAFWMAVNHVLLTEAYRDRKVEYFDEYVKQYTDLPFLVEVGDDGTAGKFVRANRLSRYDDVEHGDWKLLVWDDDADDPRMPNGTIGYRWADQEKGNWNLEMVDKVVGGKIAPRLSFVEQHDRTVSIAFDDFGGSSPVARSVPVRTLHTPDGPIQVTTVFDLLMARLGVDRGLPGFHAKSYDDENVPYTPAWQEQYTGIHRDTLVAFAREWLRNGELTRGKNLVIIGAGANHWYHNNLLYRSAITALMLTGSVGVNGGGLGHYVGQEKVVNQASWASVAFGLDWGMAPRHQNTPSFHYVHSDQWRYERGFRDYDSLPDNAPALDHTIDHQARAVRRGWLPFFPQFTQNPIDLVSEIRRGGASSNEEVVAEIANRLHSGDVQFAVDDPDAPENWPRVWFIWRGNAIGTSAKGHEFFMRHYLGADSTAIAAEPPDLGVTEVNVRPDAPVGKMDLVVDLNFRMDTSALYSDIVLPAATWYEKDDLNTTDCHSFINPMQAAVAPAWESRTDWQIFSAIAKRFTEMAAGHLPGKVEDVVMAPLAHDTPDELAQTDVVDWWKDGAGAGVPGRTMPHLRIIERNYGHLYEQMMSLGAKTRANGVAAHGLRIPVEDFYDALARRQPRRRSPLANGHTLPSLERDREVCEAILALDPASNGELAHRAFEAEEAKTGRMLRHLGHGQRDTRYDFSDIVAQPRRVLTTPTWSGMVAQGRAYSPFTFNVEQLVPWRTLTGRQHFYLDHDQYLAWGEHLPVYKPRPDHSMLSETEESLAEGQGGRMFNYITPHGKWSIHSTYSDNHRMMTLSRGGYPVWLNDKDAAELGIADNDWVELYNDNGVFVQRCVTSARIPRNTVFVYHATERTVGIPISPRRKKRAGMNNSLTRARLKPVLMSGGYAQFTYFFNYWGPTGVNRDTFVYVRRVDRPDY